VWQNGDAEYSTTLSLVISLESGRVHRLFSVFISITVLLCVCIIIGITAWRYRRQQALMADIRRRHGGRCLISTYPQMRASGEHTTPVTVALPPPSYAEAVACGPPPYNTVARNNPVPAETQSNPDSDEVESLRQSDPVDTVEPTSLTF